MTTRHFLNVKDGDCSIIQHDSNRVTVIDDCNADSSDDIVYAMMRNIASADYGVTNPSRRWSPKRKAHLTKTQKFFFTLARWTVAFDAA